MCEKCIKTYWVCTTCGSAPVSWNPDVKPEKCKNPYCSNPVLELKQTHICCQRYNHHLGVKCPHCGQRG